MKINTQQLFYPQMHFGQTKTTSFLTGSMKTAAAKNAAQKQELQQKLSSLMQNNTAQKTQKSTIVTESVGFPEMTIRKSEVPKAVSQEMERYFQSSGNVVDNLTAMEEQLTYIQKEYDKAVQENNTEKAAVLDEWLQKQRQDMSWLVDSSLGISNFRIDNAERLYGKEFGEQASELLGDLHDTSNQIAQGLKGAGSTEEALQQLAAAKEKMISLADDIASRYQDYTGNALGAYEYKTAEDYAGTKWDSHLLYSQNLQSAEALLGSEALKSLDAKVQEAFQHIDFLA